MSSDVRTLGGACAAYVRRALYLACSLTGSARTAALVEAGRRLETVRAPLEAYAVHQRTKESIHESSTTLRRLLEDLKRLGAPIAPASPEEQQRGIAEALAPHDPLADLPKTPFTAELVWVRESALWELRALVHLRAGDASWSLHVWDVWKVDGIASLTNVVVEQHSSGVTLVGAEGRLALNGIVVVVPGSEDVVLPVPAPVPDPWETAAWGRLDALVDRINTRGRWDYELEGDAIPGSLVLRGTSGSYERGCRIEFIGVHAARVSNRFSHPVFRLLSPREVPEGLRQPGPGWLSLGVETESGSSSAEHLVVVARGLRFEDDDAPEETFLVDEAGPARPPPAPVPSLVALAAHRPEVAEALAALPLLTGPGDDAPCRALWAARRYWPAVERRSTTPRSAADIATAFLSTLDQRVQLEEDADRLVVDLFAPAARRDAQRWAASMLLRKASELGDEDATLDPGLTFSFDDDRWRITEVTPSERLLVDARGALVRELVRRELGLAPQDVAIDLDRVTVGRMLADPAAEAALDEHERLARAAELVVLDPANQGGTLPGLHVLLPDPVQRARVEAMAPVVRARLPTLEPLAQTLARVGALDAAEIDFLLAGDEPAWDWYVVLRALFVGHPALRPGPARGGA